MRLLIVPDGIHVWLSIQKSMSFPSSTRLQNAMRTLSATYSSILGSRPQDKGDLIENTHRYVHRVNFPVLVLKESARREAVRGGVARVFTHAARITIRKEHGKAIDYV